MCRGYGGTRVSEAPVFGEATDYESLVAALYARKEAIGVSDRVLDEISGLSPGHVSKLIGPGRERGLSQISLDALLGSLALKLIVVEDEAQAAIMKSRWESRDSRQLRMPARIGAAFLRRARPAVMREFSRKGGLARWKGTSPELRKKLMHAVWKTRTKQAQLSASAPAEQTHGPADR
jgi:hypothetical protein